MRSKHWVYDSRVEVERIIAERKVAGNMRGTGEGQKGASNAEGQTVGKQS